MSFIKYVFLSGDQAVDYHGVFRWRICSGSGKKIYIFIELTEFNTSGTLYIGEAKNLTCDWGSLSQLPPFSDLLLPLASSVQGLLRRLTLLLYWGKYWRGWSICTPKGRSTEISKVIKVPLFHLASRRYKFISCHSVVPVQSQISFS